MKSSAPEGEVTAGPEPRSARRLNVGTLRRAVTIRMWGGKGCDAPCDFCRVLVASADVEYEVEAQLDGEIVMLHFHRRCYDAWRAGQEPSSLTPDADSQSDTPHSDSDSQSESGPASAA
jgi:hypothetical protein